MTLNLLRIRAERIAKGMTQEEMAERLGISRAAYAKREAGIVDIGANELAAISEVLGIDRDHISIFLTYRPRLGTITKVKNGRRLKSMQVMVNIPDELFRQIIEEKIAEILPQKNDTKENMNKTEAADYLGISRNTLDKLIETKGLPVKKIDGRYIFQRRALDDWLKNDEQT